MALSDKLTGQFRPKTQTQTQRPYLPTIVQDAAPARPPVAQPPAQRTPMPPTPQPPSRRTMVRRITTPLPPGYLAPDEPMPQAARGMQHGPWRIQPRATPNPSPAEQERQRTYEWEERAGDIVPPGFGFGRLVRQYHNLSPDVDWNRYPVSYVDPSEMPANATGAYHPISRTINIVNPNDDVLLHEYAHAYDIDRDADWFPDISSEPQFFANWRAVSKFPWLFAEQHPAYDSQWYQDMVDAVVRGDAWGNYAINPAELYAELAPRYAANPYNVPAQLRPYIAPMFRDQPLPPPPNPYPRPAPTPRPLLAR